MADLHAIEKELNTNTDLKKEFAKDPAKFLTDRGVSLPPETMSDLKNQVKKLDPNKMNAAWSVGVVVGN